MPGFGTKIIRSHRAFVLSQSFIYRVDPSAVCELLEFKRNRETAIGKFPYTYLLRSIRRSFSEINVGITVTGSEKYVKAKFLNS